MADTAIRIVPIGTLRSAFKEPAGVPVQPVFADETEATVEVLPEFRDGLQDLEGFERIWLVTWLHRAGEARLRVTPFLDNAEHGLFATRSPCRPNPIGLSAVRLIRIERGILHVAGIDLVDRTPILDIKPYCRTFDAFPASRSGWLETAPLACTRADDRFASPRSRAKR